MKVTVVLREELLKRAIALTGIEDKSALVQAGLEALIEKNSRQRLIQWGGTEPNLRMIRRRRSH